MTVFWAILSAIIFHRNRHLQRVLANTLVGMIETMHCLREQGVDAIHETACATFILLRRKVIVGLGNIDSKVDDIIVQNGSWSEHLSDLDKLFKRLRYHGLTAGPSKCYFGYSPINYLGFSLGNNT